MNEVLQAMKERRSIRRFKPDPVDPALIEQVIEAGLYAASSRNRQATKIIAVTSPQVCRYFREENRRIWGGDKAGDPFYGAPVILIVIADKKFPNGVYDGSLVMGNLMLAAHSLGLGSCWIHRAKEEFELPAGRKFLQDLHIEGDYEGIGHCALGYMDGELPPPLKRKENRVYYVK